MATARSMAELYEDNFKLVSKYVHATSSGHEAIQVAMGMLLKPQDYLSAYYRDDAMLLAIGMRPYDLMLQLLAKRDDPFSGGRTYYSHPSLKEEDKPKIPHQSSATGMQAIPSTGIAMGMQYRELMQLNDSGVEAPITVCSLGAASVTEGEIAEAFQMPRGFRALRPRPSMATIFKLVTVCFARLFGPSARKDGRFYYTHVFHCSTTTHQAFAKSGTATIWRSISKETLIPDLERS